ncbi:unnamed protein product [Victoria cruziana]
MPSSTFLSSVSPDAIEPVVARAPIFAADPRNNNKSFRPSKAPPKHSIRSVINFSNKDCWLCPSYSKGLEK